MQLKKNLLNFGLLLSMLALLFGCGESQDVWFSRAQQLANEKDYPAAIFELKSLLQEFPENAQARWLLATLYLDVEDGASAEKEFLQAKKLGVGEDAVMPFIARALVLQDKYDAVIELTPSEAVSKLGLAEIKASQAIALSARGQAEKAAQQMQDAVSVDSTSAWVRLMQARLLLREAQASNAKALLASLVDENPGYGLAWSLLGDIASAEKAHEDAERFYTKAIEARYNNANDRVSRGFARLARNDLAGADQDAEVLLKTAPKLPLANYFVGVVRFVQNRNDAALEFLEKAYSETAGPRVQVSYFLAAANLRAGNIERATRLAEEINSLAPNFIAGRKLLASCYITAGKDEAVIDLVQPVVRHDPADLQAKDLLATSLIRQGRLGDAMKYLEEIAAQKEKEPLAQLRAGMGLLGLGREEEGLEKLQNAIDLAPTAPVFALSAISSMLANRYTDDALSAARKLIELNGETPSTLNILGVAYAANGNQSEAKKALEKAIAVEAGNVEASANLAVLFLRENDISGARNVLDRAIEVHPTNAKLLDRLATIELADHHLVRAKEMLQRAVASDPKSLESRITLGQLLLDEDRPTEAIQLFQAYDGARSSAIEILLANANIKMGAFDDARIALERVRTKEPNMIDVHLGLARVYAELDDRRELEKTLDKLIEISPNLTDVWFAKARLYAVDGRFSEAEEILKGVQVSPDTEEMLATKLFVARAQRNYGEAVELASKMFTISSSTRTVVAYSEELEQVGRSADAISLLSKWIAEHPEDFVATRRLGEVYAHVGRVDETITLLEQVLLRDPKNYVAHSDLAWYLASKDRRAALMHSDKALELAPNSAVVLETRAVVLAQDGQPTAALDAIDDALRISNGAPLVMLRRAEILYLNGDRDSAIVELKELLNSDVPEDVRQRANTFLSLWQAGIR